jgi:hypothetical protein
VFPSVEDAIVLCATVQRACLIASSRRSRLSNSINLSKYESSKLLLESVSNNSSISSIESSQSARQATATLSLSENLFWAKARMSSLLAFFRDMNSIASTHIDFNSSGETVNLEDASSVRRAISEREALRKETEFMPRHTPML